MSQKKVQSERNVIRCISNRNKSAVKCGNTVKYPGKGGMFTIQEVMYVIRTVK
jgi:hypothetical protein